MTCSRARALLLAAAVSFAVPSLAGVWTNVGPGGGYVDTVTVDPVDPSNLYVSTGLRIFKSSDAGASWTPIEHPVGLLLTGEVGVDPVNPSTIYIPGGGATVVKSTDGGATLVSHPSVVFSAGPLLIDPTNPQNLWTGGYYTGLGAVGRSTDGGLTWTSVLLPGNVSVNIGMLAVDPLAPATIYAAAYNYSGSGLYRSTDGGASYSLVPGSPSTQAVALSPTTPGTIFASDSLASFGAGWIRKSTDGGVTWTNSGSGIAAAVGRRGLAIDPTNSSVMYAASPGGGVFKSTTGGASWFASMTGLPSGPAAQGIVIDPSTSSTLYVGTYAGVGKSTDAGATWSVLTQGLNADYTHSVAVDPTNPNVVYAGSERLTVSKSTDGGNTWAPSGTGLYSFAVSEILLDPTAPSTLYVLDGSVGKSTDGGASWVHVADGIFDGLTRIAIAPTNPSTLYASSFGGVYKTVDGAGYWTLTNGSPLLSFAAVAVDPTNDQVAWAGSGLDVYKTTDGGDTWTPTSVLPSFIGGAIRALAVDPAAPGTIYGGVAGGLVSAIVFSTDGGASWSIGKFSAYVNDFTFAPGSPSLVIAGLNGGLIASRDGFTWTDLTTLQLPYTLTTSVAATSSTVFAGIQGHSVWRRSIATCTTAAECDDSNACTTDTCDPSNPQADVLGCLHATVTCAPPGDCQTATCDPNAGCVESAVPNGTSCTDDGTVCTTDTCVGGVCTHAPDVVSSCKVPTQPKGSTLALKNVDPAKPKLTWNWKKGQATALGELGDPFTPGASDYTLCGFDRSGPGGSYALRFSVAAPAGGTCPTKPCWVNKFTKVRYKDKERTPDGADTLVLTPGPDGAAKMSMTAKGPHLSLPSAALAPDVRVQLRRDDLPSVCWEATFDANVQTNAAGVFKAKSD